MAFFAVSYTYSDDTARLDEIRPQHRAFLGSLDAVVASGPLVGPAPGRALLILRGDDTEGIEALLEDDPFHRAGLITAREVWPWKPVIGVFAGED